MRWYELAENPCAISEIYTAVPSLQDIRLKEIRLDHNGTSLTLLIDLSMLPDKAPARWEIQKYNAVHLQLDFRVIESVQITRWSTNNWVNVRIEQTANNWITVEALSPVCSIQFVAHQFKIASIHGYSREDF